MARTVVAGGARPWFTAPGFSSPLIAGRSVPRATALFSSRVMTVITTGRRPLALPLVTLLRDPAPGPGRVDGTNRLEVSRHDADPAARGAAQ